MTYTRKGKLKPAAEQMLGAPCEERIKFFQQEHWLGYPAALRLIDQLERLYHYPDTARPENLLLVSETNNGKSRLMQRFTDRHPPVDDPLGEGVQMPVVKIDVPASPDEERFYNQLLKELGIPFKITAKKDTKLFQIQKMLQQLNVKVLILDEINNCLAGNATQRQQMFNAIKGLSNSLKRPIVLTGIFEVLLALREDKQIQNRFPPVVLPKWELNRDYLQLLVSFETLLPLRRDSGLASEQLAPLLLAMSNRNLGELKKLLIWAMEEAIHSGEERITEKLLLRLPWTPPDLRDQAASAAEHGLEIELDHDARIRELGVPVSRDADAE